MSWQTIAKLLAAFAVCLTWPHDPHHCRAYCGDHIAPQSPPIFKHYTPTRG